MKASIKTIDIFRISRVRDSLLEELTMTAPEDLIVVGCELDAVGQVTSSLVRRGSPRGQMTRVLGNPPRGVFDLTDLGLDVLITYHYPHPLLLLDVMSHDHGESYSALIPVRGTTEDLAAARKIAATTIFSCSRCAFVMVDAGKPDDQYPEQFASLGPVAPIRFRPQETAAPALLPAGPVTISDMAFKEGEAMWNWLLGFINSPSA
jgi:hypothetical protein